MAKTTRSTRNSTRSTITVSKRMARESTFSEAAIAQFLQSDLAESFAGMTPGQVALAIEDRGWLVPGNQVGLDGDAQHITRRGTVLRSRFYWLMDSHASATVRTWVDYTMNGMSFKVDPGPIRVAPAPKLGEQPAPPPAAPLPTPAATAIQKFWDDPRNRTITSAEGQRRLARRHLVDGELFFVLYDTDEGVLIRKMDCVQITQFITDPEDNEAVWAYRREYVLNGQKNVLVYRDWAYPSADLSKAMVIDENGGRIAADQLLADNEEGAAPALMVHAPFNSMHQRGNSLFSASLPWMTAMREFMQDRIAITKGLAKFIQKLTVKGGQKQLDNIKAQLSKTAPGAAGPRPELAEQRRAAEQASRMFMQNDLVSLDNMPRTTGAGDAKDDFHNILLMICAANGLPEHYYGNGDNSNLATATAMELPVRKQFESYQEQWSDIWRDIFAVVANFDAPKRLCVAVDWKPIVLAEIDKVINAIVAACAEFPELVQPEILTIVLNSLGVADVDEVIVRVLAKQQELQAKAANDALNAAKGLAPDGVTPLPQPVVAPPKKTFEKGSTPPQAAPTQEVAELIAEALDRNTSALLEVLGD